MQIVSMGIGILLMLVSLYILARPAGLVSFAGQLLEGTPRYFAALLRLLFGVVLLASAAQSRYPLVFEVLGWLLVFGALLLVVFTPAFLTRIAALVARAPLWLVRLLAPLIFLFGGFIVYGFT